MEFPSADATPRRSLGEVDSSFYLIGVGASAGGLNAIKQLIGQIGDSFAHSLVIIQHISPDYKSLMSEILGRETNLEVLEVTDNMEVEPGHIYLIPPRSNVVIQGTDADSSSPLPTDGASGTHGLRFSLVAPSPRPQLNLPIDLFFTSLAEAVGNRGIAIILSGTGTDGSRGLRAVKDRDGFVMVQDPETAAFDGMPRAAIATQIVDLVAPPDAMIAELKRYFEMRESGIINVDTLFANADTEYAQLIRLVSQTADIDFSQYKEPTLKRRIARRLGICECASVRDYLALLRDDPNEVSVLSREFLVGVTNFFRDRPSWTALETEAVPLLFSEGDLGEPVKVWSVGCSTGEEPFTIALILEKYRRDNKIERDFRVFATDANGNAISAAKDGIYPDSVLQEIPDEYLLPEFFSYQAGTFQLTNRVRRRVVFAEHNVLEDSPYIRTDMIICRNLLIYLSPDMQKKVTTLFAFSLRKDGVLFLGAAEHVAMNSLGFDPMVSRARIFRNVRKPQRGLIRASLDAQYTTASALPRLRRLPAREQQRSGTTLTDLMKLTLGQFEAAVFIVEEGGFIIETFGDYRRFVDMPDQAFSSNLLDLTPDRLRSAISLLIRRAGQDNTSEKLGIKLGEGDGGVEVIDVFCSRIEWEAHPSCFALTIRRAVEIPPEMLRTQIAKAEGGIEDDTLRTYIAQLEGELEAMQEMLSATAEDLGVSNEELQTTNEELVASNEELQANNEEMQSINEELHTVNAENSEKIAELGAAYADIQLLLDATDLGVVVLDSNLCIRRFNARFATYVELTEGDAGRRLSNFASHLAEGELSILLDDAERALTAGATSERELRRADGGCALVRVRPFSTENDQLSGVVITLLDITELKELQEELALQRDRLETILDSEAAGYWDWSIPNGPFFMSPGLKEMLGYRPDEIPNTQEARDALVLKDDLVPFRRNFEAHIRSRARTPFNQELRFRQKDGSPVWVLCRGGVIEWANDGAPKRMVGVHLDMTDFNSRLAEVERRAEEIRRFAFIAAHDLMQPVNTIASSMALIAEDVTEALTEEDKPVLGFLTDAVDRLRDRVKGILEYSRLTDKDQNFSVIELSTLAKGCVYDLSDQIEKAGATVRVHALPRAFGAASLIARIFQNLVSNAIKYRHPDRAPVVEITESLAPSGKVGIRISDNGIGIPPEHRKRVFSLFYRLHAESDYEGNGLGLSISERIISLHGGTIQVEDGIDGGTAFVFTLAKEPE